MFNDGIHVNVHFNNSAVNHIEFNGVNTININNSAPIFAGDHGIYTHVDIYNKVDPSMVVTQNNTAPINVASAAIYHNITVGAGPGGDATAGVIVTNSGALTSSAAEGIYIKTNANTDGGYAHAYNQTTNSGPIVEPDDSIYSHATADTNYFGGPGSATGGTSIATVYIKNQAGGTLSSTNGEGIDGVARATADGIRLSRDRRSCVRGDDDHQLGADQQLVGWHQGRRGGGRPRIWFV